MNKGIRCLLAMMVCAILLCGNALAKNVPYTTKLNADEGIFAGPGYGYEWVQAVGEAGVYTIVEEKWSPDGARWGRLKSGAGWVKLSEAWEFNEVPYTAKLNAEDRVLKGPGDEYAFVRVVGADGVYTILEETISVDGFLWGRLKSGIGWVRLTDTPIEAPEDAAVLPYTMELGAWVDVFSGPSYDFIYEGVVGENGVYTIVDEIWDEEGNLWGCLKSGMGWIDLTYVRIAEEMPMIAGYADGELLESGEYYEYIADDSEYMEKLAFRANDMLSNVRFAILEYGEGDGYEVAEELYVLPWMYNDDALVTGVVFYGDFTTYGISFEDLQGDEYHYAIYVSGRNGALVIDEYQP